MAFFRTIQVGAGSKPAHYGNKKTGQFMNCTYKILDELYKLYKLLASCKRV
jgi:hypothetical protein